jgi:hypothetical protein
VRSAEEDVLWLFSHVLRVLLILIVSHVLLVLLVLLILIGSHVLLVSHVLQTCSIENRAVDVRSTKEDILRLKVEAAEDGVDPRGRVANKGNVVWVGSALE